MKKYLVNDGIATVINDVTFDVANDKKLYVNYLDEEHTEALFKNNDGYYLYLEGTDEWGQYDPVIEDEDEEDDFYFLINKGTWVLPVEERFVNHWLVKNNLADVRAENNLEKIMNKKNITVDDLSEMTKDGRFIPVPQLKIYIKGQEIPDIYTQERLAKFLGVELLDIWADRGYFKNYKEEYERIYEQMKYDLMHNHKEFITALLSITKNYPEKIGEIVYENYLQDGYSLINDKIEDFPIDGLL